MSTFSEGQIVELKSGGPQMTIQSIDGSDAVCIWFTGDKLMEKNFPFATLIATAAEALSDKVLEDIIRGMPQESPKG
jgi:uncharacterized protein YodC (DUF2158 family)